MGEPRAAIRGGWAASCDLVAPKITTSLNLLSWILCISSTKSNNGKNHQSKCICLANCEISSFGIAYAFLENEDILVSSWSAAAARLCRRRFSSSRRKSRQTDNWIIVKVDTNLHFSCCGKTWLHPRKFKEEKCCILARLFCILFANSTFR